METKDAIATIYLDIETKPGEEPRLDSFSADKRLKDPVKIADDLEEKKEKKWRQSMLDPYDGGIYCIGLAVNLNKPFVLHSDNEEELIRDFDEWLIDYSYPRVVGHNIIDFDGYWLFVKGLKYRAKNVVEVFSHTRMMIDTMRLMDGGAWKKMTSQDKMARTLGFPGKGDIDGSKVFDYLKAGKGEAIRAYCISDVDTLRKCHIELEAMGVIPR